MFIWEHALHSLWALTEILISTDNLLCQVWSTHLAGFHCYAVEARFLKVIFNAIKLIVNHRCTRFYSNDHPIETWMSVITGVSTSAEQSFRFGSISLLWNIFFSHLFCMAHQRKFLKGDRILNGLTFKWCCRCLYSLHSYSILVRVSVQKIVLQILFSILNNWI